MLLQLLTDLRGFYYMFKCVCQWSAAQLCVKSSKDFVIYVASSFQL